MRGAAEGPEMELLGPQVAITVMHLGRWHIQGDAILIPHGAAVHPALVAPAVLPQVRIFLTHVIPLKRHAGRRQWLSQLCCLLRSAALTLQAAV